MWAWTLLKSGMTNPLMLKAKSILEALMSGCRLRLKCDGTRAETRIFLSVKRTSPYKSAGASVKSTAGS